MNANISIIQASVLAGAAISVILFLIAERSMRRLPALPSVPTYVFLAWCTWFTIGFAVLGTSVPMLIPFGIILIALGIMPFLPESFSRAIMRLYILGLGVGLLYVIQTMRLEYGTPITRHEPSILYAGGLIILWGTCILLANRRWNASQHEKQ